MKRMFLGFVAGIAMATSSACGGPTVDVDAPFQVIHSAPQHGGTDIGTDVVPSIGFNAQINPNSSHAITLQEQGSNSFELISSTVFIESDGFLVTLLPNDFLKANTRYQVVASTELFSADGEPLLTRYRAEFTTGSD